MDLEKENGSLHWVVHKHSEQSAQMLQRMDQLSKIKDVLNHCFLLYKIDRGEGAQYWERVAPRWRW